MADPKSVGHIRVELYEDGTVGVDIENVPYIQQYGIAQTLQEMARQSHAMDHMRQMQAQGKIVPASSMPSNIRPPREA